MPTSNKILKKANLNHGEAKQNMKFLEIKTCIFLLNTANDFNLMKEEN